MTTLSRHTFEFLVTTLEADSVDEIGRLFFERLQPFGVRASYIRSYGGGVVGEHVYSRVSPPGWEDFYKEEGFGQVNYLPREIRRRTGAFAWSDVHLKDPQEIALARALSSHGFPDGLAVPCHGARGYAAAVSLAFQDLSGLSPAERLAIELTSVMLHERMRSLSNLGVQAWVPLTSQERDVLAFAADGRSDYDISDLTGLPEAAVVRLAKSYQAKLGVHTKTQAVARALHLGLLTARRHDQRTSDHFSAEDGALGHHLKHDFLLSAAEVRLAIALFKGATLKQVAERSGTSLNTSRVQLARVFSKTGVHRQAELIRLMYELTLTF